MVPNISTPSSFTTAQNLHPYEMDESGHVSNSERWSDSPCCLRSVPEMPFSIFPIRAGDQILTNPSSTSLKKSLHSIQGWEYFAMFVPEESC